MKTILKKMLVALIPRSWMLKTRLRNGAIVYGRNRPGYGGRGIYIFGESLEPELEHLDKFLGESGVFADLGASTGVYAMKAAVHYRNRGVVLAIEPFYGSIAALCRSIEANSLSNVRLRSLCVGGDTGLRSFWANSGRPNQYSLIKHDEKATHVPVLTFKFDDLFDLERLDRLDYLKIDVEGSEHEVLMGAAKTIEKYRPIIQTEIIRRNCALELPDYRIFHAPNSANNIYIAKEHPKIDAAAQLGWNEVAPESR